VLDVGPHVVGNLQLHLVIHQYLSDLIPVHWLELHASLVPHLVGLGVDEFEVRVGQVRSLVEEVPVIEVVLYQDLHEVALLQQTSAQLILSHHPEAVLQQTHQELLVLHSRALLEFITKSFIGRCETELSLKVYVPLEDHGVVSDLFQHF
jgi:hypothetical protein